jgi:hypothetical protein
MFDFVTDPVAGPLNDLLEGVGCRVQESTREAQSSGTDDEIRSDRPSPLADVKRQMLLIRRRPTRGKLA